MAGSFDADTLSSSPVSSWTGSVNSAAQATGANRPAWSATGLDGTHAAVTGADSTDGLTLGTSIGSGALTTTMVALGKLATSGTRTIAGGVNNSPQFRVNGSGKLSVAQQAVAERVASATTLTAGNIYLMGMQTKNSNAGVNVYLNGTQDGSYSGTTGFTAGITTLMNLSAFNSGWANAMSHISILNSESDDLRQAVEGYAAHKYGQAALLPIDHPYKSAPPVKTNNINLVTDGNSITDGTAGPSWPRRVAESAEALGLYLTNVAVSGQTIGNMSSDAAAQIDPLISGTKTNVLAAMECRNDIFLNSLSARSAVDRFWSYCDARRAAGWTVVAITPLDSVIGSNTTSGDTPTQHHDKLVEIRDLMIAEWEDHADAFVDLWAVPELADVTNLTYFADGTHPTSAGYQIMADAIMPVILSI